MDSLPRFDLSGEIPCEDEATVCLVSLDELDKVAAASNEDDGPLTTVLRVPPAIRKRHLLLPVFLVSVAIAAVLATSVMAATSRSAGGSPVGVAMHKPMSLDRSVRSCDRIGGFSPRLVNVVTVSIDELRPVSSGF